jgi:hypothetical protein
LELVGVDGDAPDMADKDGTTADATDRLKNILLGVHLTNQRLVSNTDQRLVSNTIQWCNAPTRKDG